MRSGKKSAFTNCFVIPQNKSSHCNHTLLIVRSKLSDNGIFLNKLPMMATFSSQLSNSRKPTVFWLVLLTTSSLIVSTVGVGVLYSVQSDNVDQSSSHKTVIDNLKPLEEKYEEPVQIEIIKKVKRSALLSSGSTAIEGSSDPGKVYRGIIDRIHDDENQTPRAECRKRRLNMCKGHVPFNSTVFPNIIGDENEADANRSIPFFNLIAKSGCNKRLKQLLCTFLEPPCHNGRPIPPCKKFCRVALEGCAEYIPATLELSSVFDCRQYPDSTDPSVCVNLAMGNGCAADEFHCPDKSCIPKVSLQNFFFPSLLKHRRFYLSCLLQFVNECMSKFEVASLIRFTNFYSRLKSPNKTFFCY